MVLESTCESLFLQVALEIPGACNLTVDLPIVIGTTAFRTRPSYAIPPELDVLLQARTGSAPPLPLPPFMELAPPYREMDTLSTPLDRKLARVSIQSLSDQQSLNFWIVVLFFVCRRSATFLCGMCGRIRGHCRKWRRSHGRYSLHTSLRLCPRLSIPSTTGLFWGETGLWSLMSSGRWFFFWRGRRSCVMTTRSRMSVGGDHHWKTPGLNSAVRYSPRQPLDVVQRSLSAFTSCLRLSVSVSLPLSASRFLSVSFCLSLSLCLSVSVSVSLSHCLSVKFWSLEVFQNVPSSRMEQEIRSLLWRPFQWSCWFTRNHFKNCHGLFFLNFL